MGRKIISLFICLLIVMPATAFGEGKENQALKMEELTIQVMPEFAKHPEDKESAGPSVLIGYQGNLINKSGKVQKGKIELPLPMDEKNFRIGFVADYASDLSEMYEIEYELDLEKGTISWETSRDIEPNDQYKFVVEFYTDSLTAKKTVKTLDYTFKSFTDITLLNITVVEPMKASNAKAEPKPSDTPHENSYGLNMHTYQVKGMKAGQEKNVKLTYERSETKTTSELMDEMGGAAPKPIKKVDPEKVPLGLTIAGISAASLLAAGLIILFLKKRQQPIAEPAVEAAAASNKRARLRKMLAAGDITEDEYNRLLKKMTL